MLPEPSDSPAQPSEADSDTPATAEGAEPAAAEKSQPAVTLESLDKVFCADLWRSSRYALFDLLTPAALRRRTADKPLRPQEFYALRDVSFTVAKGETVGVLGLRRSGKSTLANVVGGLYPPDRGRVSVPGRTALVNAESGGCRPMLTLRENLRFRAALYGADRAWLRERTDEVLEFAGLRDQAERPTFNADPIHVRRLGLSIALHLEADTFVFDESLSLRDPVLGERAQQRLFSLLEGRSALILSQDRDLLWTYATRGLVLDRGQIVFDGPIDEAILTLDQLRENERMSGNLEASLDSSQGLLDEEEGEEADLESETGEETEAEQPAEGPARAPYVRAMRPPLFKGPSFETEHVQVAGMEVDRNLRFWFLFSRGETVELAFRLRALRKIEFDGAWIALHRPGLEPPIGTSPVEISGLSLASDTGRQQLAAGQHIEVQGSITIPQLTREHFGLSFQVGIGGAQPAKSETVKIAGFGILEPEADGKGVTLSWSGSGTCF
ncbi:MAG: ATP-binding cassette domain-containing protein [Tistlia sp.]